MKTTTEHRHVSLASAEEAVEQFTVMLKKYASDRTGIFSRSCYEWAIKAYEEANEQVETIRSCAPQDDAFFAKRLDYMDEALARVGFLRFNAPSKINTWPKLVERAMQKKAERPKNHNKEKKGKSKAAQVSKGAYVSEAERGAALTNAADAIAKYFKICQTEIYELVPPGYGVMNSYSLVEGGRDIINMNYRKTREVVKKATEVDSVKGAWYEEALRIIRDQARDYWSPYLDYDSDEWDSEDSDYDESY
ncbi:hypothetical protein F4821DRAFT_263906 [Hypoxylon rubiginosum]|uniref:Uncharacterized protein n=1 Tax=Hypoxylon rubiginosum TaxID=110542 RepID=A0ACC0CQC4_9PEZI|nr:hypothetical protein F4821DRAFT_263906 [Hypoxylon rubiginosum]